MKSSGREGGGRSALRNSQDQVRQIHKSRLAERDLIDIWIYTFQRWGAPTADTYLDELHESIHKLAGNPELGARRDFVSRGYSALSAKSHVIYYKTSPGRVLVVRVLHKRMDAALYLE